MKSRLDLDNKVAVVTGAASGIGRALALELMQRGCNLALVDVDAAGLAEISRLVGNKVRLSWHCIDIADADAVARLPAEILATHGQVDLLVNNAGVALGGTFEQVTERDFDWLMAINFSGLVRMTRAFLPLLKDRPDAQLVNVSSLFGLVAPPGQTAYAAAKFAVRGFSESLRQELLAEGSSVGVSVIHPGGVRTKIVQNARDSEGVDASEAAQQRDRFSRALRLSPERAATQIVDGIVRRRPRILIGSDAKIASAIERLMPVGYWRLLGRAFK